MKRFFIGLLFLTVVGCVPPDLVPTRRTLPPQPSATPAPEQTVPVESGLPKALFYVVHPDGEPKDILNVLHQSPQLKLTLIFPPRYFNQATRKEAVTEFRVLQSSGQIEIALTLDNQPMLPLLADFSRAGPKAREWGINFAWMEDVAGQMARGSGQYNKNWEQLPSGFYPPHLAISKEVADAFKRFRLHWVLAAPAATYGVMYEGATTVIVPPPLELNEELQPGSKAWAEDVVARVVSQPYSLIDFSAWDDPSVEKVFLQALIAKSKSTPSLQNLVTGQEFSDIAGDHWKIDSSSLYKYDYSDWVKNDQQRLAWIALVNARKVLETYKDSGRADLRRLDAATEEMYLAEGGEFLFVLGDPKTSLTLNEKNFLATIANVYRLCGVPVPGDLNRWFSNRSFRREITTEKGSEPFFVAGNNRYQWNDPRGDDNGDGSFTYPIGKYATGAFDLRQFTVSWTDSDVAFSATMEGMTSEKINLVLPLIDVYIDINRFAGAGSTSLLEGRAGAIINKEGAWEYAISMTPGAGAVFQSVPGKEERSVMQLKPRYTNENKTVTISIPLSVLRGNPSGWRFTVMVSGAESGKAGLPRPVPIRPQSSQKNFGGASSHRVPPTAIDLLMETADDQKETIGAYSQGGLVGLPFVEPQ